MSVSRDDIVVRIAGDLSDIQRSLKDLQKRTKDAGNQARRSGRDWGSLGSSLDGIRNRITGIVGAYLSFQGLRTVTGFIRDTALALEDVDRQARALGASRQSIQELIFTFRQFGLDTNDVSDALGTLADRARDAEAGQKSFVDDFKLLGVAIDDLRGKSPEELFAVMARRIAEIEDPTRRTAGIVRIFGDDLGRRLSPLLIEGEEGLRRYADAAREAGQVLEDDAVDSMLDLNKTVKDLGNELRGQGIRAVAEYADEIRSLAIVLGTAAEQIIGLTGGVAKLTVRLGEGLGIALARFTTGSNNPNDHLETLRGNIRETEKELARLQGRQRFGGQGNEQLRAEIAILEQRLNVLRQTEQTLSNNPTAFDIPLPEAEGTAPTQSSRAAPVIDGRPALAALQAQLKAAGVLLTDELKRLREQLDQDLADNLVSFEEYYRRRAELETGALDNQLQQQRNALSQLDEEIRLISLRGEAVEDQENKRAELVAKITVLERQRADVATNAAREQARAERELATQLGEVRIRLQELQGDTVGARQSQLENEFRDLLKRLSAEGDEEGTALVRRLINVEAARARLTELENEYSRTLDRLSRAEQRVDAQVETGVITQRQGREQIIDLHRETADELERLIPLMEELAAATGDPTAIERLEQMRFEVEQLGTVVNRDAQQMRESLRDAGESAFSSFISGAQDARGAWDSFVDNIRQKAADLISEQLFEKLFSGLDGAAGGDGFFATLLGGLFHEGGIAGQARQFKRVPAIAFAGAPRYHSGGFPGLAPGEVPAVLQTGEEVLSRKDPRNRLNGSQRSTVVNVYANDVQSFARASRGQIGSAVGAELARARNRNG